MWILVAILVLCVGYLIYNSLSKGSGSDSFDPYPEQTARHRRANVLQDQRKALCDELSSGAIGRQRTEEIHQELKSVQEGIDLELGMGRHWGRHDKSWWDI
jgi:hypothetical protein